MFPTIKPLAIPTGIALEGIRSVVLTDTTTTMEEIV